MTKTHLCSSPSRRPPLLAGWRVLMLAGCLHLPLLPLVVGPAHANDEDKVTLNFVNADIETVTKAVSQITGKNFLLDPRVKGTVNVISSRPVPKSLAYQFLLSALRMQGFAAVENKGMVRILPEADAKTHGGPTQARADKASGDQLVTRVFHLNFQTASGLVPVIRPLIAPNNPINANPGNNSIVISDYADNMDRLARIIATLDTPFGDEPQIIPLRHASAIDVAAMLNRIFGGDSGNAPAIAGASMAAAANGADAVQRITILPDTRSNALIVRSENSAKLAQLRALVATFDQPNAQAGNIHVVYLKNAEATKVAQTLRAIISGDASNTGLTSSSLTPLSQTTASGSPATSPAAAPLNTALNTTAGSGNAGTAGSILGLTAGNIQADAANNALIITAAEPVYNNLRRVIDQLDKRRAQVLVEALIVELTSDRASELGIQWLGGSTSSSHNTATLANTNFGSGGKSFTGLIEGLAKAKSTGTLGIAPGLNLGIFSNPAGLGMLVRALENDANANILSTPNLLTLDNEEAKIVIGSNVPFISGQYAATGNSVTATPFQTYDR
ncbi:MAG: type II secretion system secretin GspD, partial [Sterolibacterium sp.]|nr:type II secretion system secretin GspD [Sterolibacterium sp.]